MIIHWFRQDLRIADNPALFRAAEQGCVLPIYILDSENSGEHALGKASQWWLHHSLKVLSESLNGKLAVFKGDATTILQELVKTHNVSAVYWNRCYEPWRITRDKVIKEKLLDQNIEPRSFKGSLLWEPWEVLKKDQTAYKVFTPYFRKCRLDSPQPRDPLPRPSKIDLADTSLALNSIDELGLLPRIEWYRGFEAHWQVGESAAMAKLFTFSDEGLANYKKGRDFPALNSVSRLSPHLHFGEISPNQVWHHASTAESTDSLTHFLSEIGWREFAHHLLYHFPKLPTENLQAKFDNFPWNNHLDNNQEHLKRWQMGQTGFPLVDAGMRELWQTGTMHNRVRMVVGSFLVKNLMLDWRHGERWFWDCLLDADLANNSAAWQWISGCGADAAPYFRIFNPTTQGQKFDPEGTYTKTFVPELRDMPSKYLYNPWEASQEVLASAGVRLGVDYPNPVVDLKQSRAQALEAFSTLKQYHKNK